MAIVKKPKASHTDAHAARFIADIEKPAERDKRVQTTMRFDPDLLKRVDVAAKRRGISRSAWIQYTVSKALDEET